MISVTQESMVVTIHPRVKIEEVADTAVKQDKAVNPWAPCEEFVRSRLGWASPVLTPLAQTADFYLDYFIGPGYLWSARDKLMGYGTCLGTYEDIMKPWYTGQTPQERMKGIRAFCGATVHESDDEVLPLDDYNLLRSLVDPEFKKKYFDGKRGFPEDGLEFIRMTFKERVTRPCALLHVRKFVDFMIGQQDDLAAAQAAVKRLLPRAHPDRYEHFIRGEPVAAQKAAQKIYAALTLVRDMLRDPIYGPALYEPRRVERSQIIGWKLGVTTGVAAAGFFLRPGRSAARSSSRSALACHGT